MENKFKILDCTLRDGGYINSWEFGEKTISSIIDKLNNAEIDIIECGFLTQECVNSEYSLFNKVSEIEKILKRYKTSNHKSMLVAMIAIGEKEIDPTLLEEYNGRSIEGIRLTFHQHEIEKAMNWAKIIMNKGYKVFMQPVGTTSYNDLEILELVEKINHLSPYAFYIVDTLGSMYKNELLHIFYLLDKNLNMDIHIGFHAHNNLQMAFANAQELTRIHTKRNLIIDASIYGMGRGAGNLPTELIAEYINKNIRQTYHVTELLDIYDEYISIIRERYEWGYSIPYHIAASNICHPNYASYLINKQTLKMKDIKQIIMSIPKAERVLFNKKLIEKLYLEYQNNNIDDNDNIIRIHSLLNHRKILILAPGKSLRESYDMIRQFIVKEKPYVISVNFYDSKFDIDACFVSNHKRIESIESRLADNRNVMIIATSNVSLNIKMDICYVNYYSYINSDEMVFDNAGLMLMYLLRRCGASNFVLAGFDGFKTRYDENYYDSELTMQIDTEKLNEKQLRMKKQFREISDFIKIDFLTSSVYEE